MQAGQTISKHSSQVGEAATSMQSVQKYFSHPLQEEVKKKTATEWAQS
jgi:hypothetical protein